MASISLLNQKPQNLTKNKPYPYFLRLLWQINSCELLTFKFCIFNFKAIILWLLYLFIYLSSFFKQEKTINPNSGGVAMGIELKTSCSLCNLYTWSQLIWMSRRYYIYLLVFVWDGLRLLMGMFLLNLLIAFSWYSLLIL